MTPLAPFPQDSIQAILFDLDGTLVVSANHWAERLALRLEPLRRRFPRLDTGALSRHLILGIETPVNYLMSVMEHVGLSTEFFGLADRMRRSKGLATRSEVALIEGTTRLLTALHGRYQLAAVTTRARAEALSFVERARLSPYLTVIITRQDGFWMKPHPGPVRRAAQRLGARPEQCLMVGDTTMDVRAGRRAGAYTVGVLSGFAVREELEAAGAHLVLERAEQLLDWLPVPEDAPAPQASIEP